MLRKIDNTRFYAVPERDTQMSTLLEKPAKVSRVVATSASHARAIDDPIRAKMLATLYRRELNAEQIAKELGRAGYKKALTTMRHHLEILRSAGLVEVVRIEEARGAITKYYGAVMRILDYPVPEDFESKYSAQIESAQAKVRGMLKQIPETEPPKGKGTSDYRKYLLLEIFNRAVANVLEGTPETKEKTEPHK